MATPLSLSKLTNSASQSTSSLATHHTIKSHHDLVSLSTNESNTIPFSIELMDKIVAYTYYSSKPSRIFNRAKNLESISLVNKTFYQISLMYKYNYCKFIRSNMFYRFLLNLMNNNYLGKLVETLDFQEFTSIGLGRSGQMMSEIQNLTSRTLLQCLKLTPNLKQFLVSESIENDINQDIVNHLFNNLPVLESLDFCGASGDQFSNSFQNLEIINNYSLKKISFHDCTDLPKTVFESVLPNLFNLERLDLAHTKISCQDLNKFLNPNAKLTHFSLSKCSNLGSSRELVYLIVNNTSINNENLQWLNLQNGYSGTALNSVSLTYILSNLVSANLKYLNLNGHSEINEEHLKIISEKFPLLESLSISNSHILNYSALKEIINLKYIDISMSLKTRGELENFLDDYFLDSNGNDNNNNLESIEINLKLGDNLPKVFKSNNQFWRCFNNGGTSRRVWIHKILSKEDSELYDNFTSGLVHYDIETGKKFEPEFKKPIFLRYASRKINCCKNLDYEFDDGTFPNEMNQRGIYKYYSLNN